MLFNRMLISFIMQVGISNYKTPALLTPVIFYDLSIWLGKLSSQHFNCTSVEIFNVFNVHDIL